MDRNEFKNSLKRINLKSFAEDHYNVKWQGNKAICCFPGHTEKTASMYYVEDGNYIYCLAISHYNDLQQKILN